MVWINDSNTTALNAFVVDAIPAGTQYIANSLTCTGQGATVVHACTYNAAQQRIEVTADIAPDPGATDETQAANELVIRFRTTVRTQSDQIRNQGEAFWDENGDGVVNSADANVAQHRPVYTDDPAQPGAADPTVAQRPALPQTGFTPNKQTILPPMPADYRYPYVGSLWLEIPRLGLSAPIVGVPKHNGQWDVTWLWNQAGWLEGTAFPTWDGNTVLTGHVYLPNGKPGPFVNIHDLHWGDIVIIHAWGKRFVYFVENTALVAPDDLRVLKHKEGDWITLLTCRGYEPSRDTYRWRYVVQAKRIYWTNELQRPLH